MKKTITLHLSEPTIPAILISKNSIATQIKLKTKNLKLAFKRRKALLSTRQPPNFCKLLITAKFERLPIPKQIKVRLFPSANCIYHNNGYFKECLSFSFKSKNKLLTQDYKRFSCDSKDVLYVLICNNCEFFYIEQTDELKQRTQKHKSDLIHPNNSNCKKCSEHLRTCSNMSLSCLCHVFVIHHIIFIVFYQWFCFIQLFSNVIPINNIIPTSLFDIIVVTLAILYIRIYSLVQIPFKAVEFYM